MSRMSRILLTGATGYIGSHTWLALQEAGFEVVGLDNHANSSPKVLERLQSISGQAPTFVKADVTNRSELQSVFSRFNIDAVVHFAAFKAVGESTQEPLRYYRNNVEGLLTLCEVMQQASCRHFIFSSSATVYGQPKSLPIREDAPVQATNPYGHTKLIGEQILHDLAAADPSWRTAVLRYFNPVGAHTSGLIGEDPLGIPNNLMPYVAQVAIGRRAALQIFGRDYNTPDGTGVRDYIHVMDLAEGHVAALKTLLQGHAGFTVNLGTGRGYSVIELMRAYEQASGRPIAHEFVQRRPGDVDACYADPTLAKTLLGWSAQRDLADMCADSWRWQSGNPEGFGQV